MDRAIQVVERASGVVFEEVVAGRKSLEFIISTAAGKVLLEWIVKKRWFSFIYGLYQDSPLSKRAIEPFVNHLGIDMKESEKKTDQFSSFNDFFIRTLHKSARPIESNKNRLALPADGRITCISRIEEGQVLQVKGVEFSLAEFLGNKELAAEYEGGSMIIVRLCPADYHRFHFPCTGTPGTALRIAGHLYSVNPLAIRSRPGLFAENERQICIHENPEVGRILLIDVGATMVGKIIQTYKPGQGVEKGDERGYFKFGASTTVMVFPSEKVRIDEDLVQNSQKGLETYAKMGEGFATIMK